MAVTLYESTDSGAPVLTGASGSLASLLLACLVNGYGARQGAGWALVFTGTNKVVLRNTSGVLYRFQDDVQVGFGTGSNAIVTGYETMSSVDVGTNPFPSHPTKFAYACKSTTPNDAAAHPWLVLADGATAYFFADCTNAGKWVDAGWGSFARLRGSDAFAQFVGGANSVGVNTNVGPFRFPIELVTEAKTSHAVLAIQRSYTGLAGAIASDQYGNSAVSFYGNSAWLSESNDAAGIADYPSHGRIMLAEWHLGETAAPTVRGKLRGLWHWCHPYASVNHGDTFPGGPGGALIGLPGREFRVVKPTGAAGVYVLETSDTWDLPV